MKTFKEQLDAYAVSQSGANKLFQYVSIPAMVLGVLILLNWFSVSILGQWNITFAWVGVALLFFYYFRLHVRLAIAITAVLAIANLLCTLIAYPTPSFFSGFLFLILFAGGFLLQFSGTVLPKNKATTLSILSGLLIAPIYWFIQILRLLKIEKYFDFVEVHQDSSETPPSSS